MERIGELPEFKRIAKRTKPSTSAQIKLEESATQIALNPATKDDAAFMARQLIQCTLPHRNPGNIPAWSRRNGSLSLGITPGWDHKANKSIGYPYGSIPRLLLFWITSEAVRRKHLPIEEARRLDLGHSLSEFMRDVGLSPSTGGGKRSDAHRLQGQMRRLFQSTISFHQTVQEQHRQGERWLNMQVAPRGEFWWDPRDPAQETLWGSYVILGEDFFASITAAAVPADMRVLKALKQSPLALDLYALLNYLGATVKEPKFVSWSMLMQQLGTDVDDIRNFRRKTLAALRKVRAHHRGLKLRQVKGGLSISPGVPAVPRLA
jgi:hypothetical protein